MDKYSFKKLQKMFINYTTDKTITETEVPQNQKL